MFCDNIFVDIQNMFFVAFSVGLDILLCVIICLCPLGVQPSMICCNNSPINNSVIWFMGLSVRECLIK